MKRAIFVLCGALFFVELLSTLTLAQIAPSQDAYTNSASPTTNYGTATTLGVANTGASIQTAYIQLDLSSVPAGYTSANIAKATLKLYVNSVTTAGSFNVDFVNGAWQEKKITYSLSPALGNIIASSVALTSANVHDYVLIDVTSAVGAWLDGSQANDGIALVANSPLSATIDSKENTSQSHPAELDIVFNGAITGITTASGSGLTGGGNTGTLNLSLMTSCSSGQILAWTGSAWACKTVSGTGTVTSVGLSAPASDFVVSGSPITASGTLNIAWTVPPDSHNTANAIVKRDSSGSFNASNITATGQITVNNGFSLNPIISTASAANAAAIVGGAVGTGLTDGVLGSSFSSGKGSSGVIGLDQNSNGSAGNYTTGLTGVTQNAYGVGVLGYGVLSGNATADIGYYRAGVWGDDATGAGVVATSDSGNAAIAVNTSATSITLLAQNNASGNTVTAINTSTTNPTLLAQNNTGASNGVVFRAAAPNVQSNGSSAFCQVSTHGDMGCTGDVYQNSPANGLVKALVYFDPFQPAGSQIVYCFNSSLLEPAASTPPCGFTVTHQQIGQNLFDFGFKIDNRFIQSTTAGAQRSGSTVSSIIYESGSTVSLGTYYPSDGALTDVPLYMTVF